MTTQTEISAREQKIGLQLHSLIGKRCSVLRNGKIKHRGWVELPPPIYDEDSEFVLHTRNGGEIPLSINNIAYVDVFRHTILIKNKIMRKP